MSASAAGIAAVLCDLDGVIRHWDRRVTEDLHRRHGLPAGTLEAAAFAPERLLPAVTGAVRDAEWRAAVREALVPACGSEERARVLVEDWSRHPGRADEEALALIAEVRTRVPVVLVTNATDRLEPDLSRLGIAGAFDAIANSARLGFAKPDARVYAVAATMAGAPAGRCLFIDDSPDNVAAAGAVGMRAVLARGAAGLRTALAPLLG
ncbi:HAD family hydrolase [Nocardiopsis potens]|uniref:HAD family hydrolase n=1 Tax=Nocardiopsis potens TaxID=1246458 RepID=UPI000348B1FD|nr:HAD-IA family hydrolase [Nocardiopsis potens]